MITPMLAAWLGIMLAVDADAAPSSAAYAPALSRALHASRHHHRHHLEEEEEENDCLAAGLGIKGVRVQSKKDGTKYGTTISGPSGKQVRVEWDSGKKGWVDCIALTADAAAPTMTGPEPAQPMPPSPAQELTADAAAPTMTGPEPAQPMPPSPAQQRVRVRTNDASTWMRPQSNDGSGACDYHPKCSGLRGETCEFCLHQYDKPQELKCATAPTGFDQELDRIRATCEAQKLGVDIQSYGGNWWETMMPAHDQCVVKEVAQLFHKHVNIMDCKFGASVTAACKKAPTAPKSPWKKCPSVWDAYINEGNCAAGAGALSVKDGKPIMPPWFIGQSPADFVASKNTLSGECKKFGHQANREELVKLLEYEASHYMFSHIMGAGCAVCATVGQAGVYAYKKAGLLGRIDVVQERYGGTGSMMGHVFLMYSTLSDSQRIDVNNPCKAHYSISGLPDPSNTQPNRLCHAQFIDNWYAGLRMGLTIDDIVKNRGSAIHYSAFGANCKHCHYLTTHSVNGWRFEAPREKHLEWGY